MNFMFLRIIKFVGMTMWSDNRFFKYPPQCHPVLNCHFSTVRINVQPDKRYPYKRRFTVISDTDRMENKLCCFDSKE